MARKRFGIAVLATVTILVAGAFAQGGSSEVAGLVGRSFIANQSSGGATIHFGDGLSYEGNFSHRFLNFGVAGISVEVPFVYNPTTKLQYGGPNSVPRDFNAYFLTPAARLNLFPTTAFSPWVSVGGGFGRFSPNGTLEFGGPNPNPGTVTRGVIEFGGGLDIAVSEHFKIRGEVRDFNSQEPPINLNLSSRYNHLMAGAGVVFAF